MKEWMIQINIIKSKASNKWFKELPRFAQRVWYVEVGMNIGIVAVGHSLAWMIDNIEGFGEPTDAICVMLLSQQDADGFASGEAFQQLPPQQHVLGAQLADFTVGRHQKVLLAFHAVQYLYHISIIMNKSSKTALKLLRNCSKTALSIGISQLSSTHRFRVQIWN